MLERLRLCAARAEPRVACFVTFPGADTTQSGLTAVTDRQVQAGQDSNCRGAGHSFRQGQFRRTGGRKLLQGAFLGCLSARFHAAAIRYCLEQAVHPRQAAQAPLLVQYFCCSVCIQPPPRSNSKICRMQWALQSVRASLPLPPLQPIRPECNSLCCFSGNKLHQNADTLQIKTGIAGAARSDRVFEDCGPARPRLAPW